jgi:DNA (cytosine-5)-methyltransferase 1
MTNKLKHGAWYLKDLEKIPKKNISVFSIFSCGGGSTMGYKLAGCTVKGCVEIDEKLMTMYKENHNPQFSYKMAIQDFNKLPISDIPDELKNLDILDGSPPCSSFSTAGVRDKKWGKEHFFREGQEVQILDDLFFHFIETAEILKPKIVIAENVKGLITGKAKGYVKEIFLAFDKAGYNCQLFLFNAAKMGVPQSRARVFFIASRKDLKFPKLKFEFNEPNISYFDAMKGINAKQERQKLRNALLGLWRATKAGHNLGTAHPKGNFFSFYKINPKVPVNCITANGPTHMLWDKPYYLSKQELVRLQTFPEDYNFLDQQTQYVTGMSVPPFMIQRIVASVIEQWSLST